MSGKKGKWNADRSANLELHALQISHSDMSWRALPLHITIAD